MMLKKYFPKTEHIVFLRAIATIAVVLYHSRPSLEIGELPHHLIALTFNWCVPIFFMISGALFLNSEKTITFKYMFVKVLHIVKIIFLWGLIYNIISTIIIEHSISLNIFKKTFLMVLKADTTYCYQFWYLYVLVGIYLLIPMLKPWADKYIYPDNIPIECFFTWGCWLVLSIVLPSILFGLGISSDIWKGAFNFFSGYLFYVICGRLYDCIGTDKRYNKFFILIIATFILQLFFFIYIIFIGQHSKIESWYGYNSFFTWNMSSVLYLSIRKIDFTKINSFIRKIYTVIAKYSFQIYILHVIILQIVRKIGFTDDLINPWIYPIINISITISVCVLISYICKKIPTINRLLY